jgi:hypothetical protein
MGPKLRASYSLAAGAMCLVLRALYAGYLVLNCVGLFYLMNKIVILSNASFARQD